MKRKNVPGSVCRCSLSMGWLVAFLSVSACATDLVAAAGLPAPSTVELWPQGAPGAHGDSAEDRPAVTAYVPAADRNTGASVVIFPGGGFARRCEDHEGVLAAEWLRAHGVAAFIVRYRIVPIGTVKDAQIDAQRGVQYVRAHAAQWGVSPQRLGVLGFSAGATLAADVALRPRLAQPDAADPIERVSSRPDFLVLAYGDANQMSPGVRGLAATGLPPSEAAQLFAPTAEDIAAAPPAFLFCTAEDASHVRGMSDLYSRLVGAGRSAEAHFFAFGEHGVGFAVGDPLLGQWPSFLLSWMRTSGFLTGAPRVALRGSVTLDGAPLPRGSVILTPLQGEASPAVVAYVFGTSEAPGHFLIPAERGPTPGRYRVEVRQDARRWASNSRDPVYLEMQEKTRGGAALSAHDVELWLASVRRKDFSPSIAEQLVYKRRRPGDAEDIVVEIAPGRENRLDLALSSR
jgi:acetyl esterase/lipase